MNHEWLSEIPFYLAFQAKGLQGLLAVYFLLYVLIFAIVYYRACTSGANCKDAILTTVLGIALGVVSMGPRLLLFGWLCMGALLLVLDRFRHSGKGLWILPPLFALWINLHGSWIYGMIVFVVTITSGLVAGKWGQVEAQRWSLSELKMLLIAAAASVAALFVNPFGYRLLLYPFDLLFRQTSNMKHIEEWQSVDFSATNGRVAMIMILGLLAVIWYSRRRWRLDEVALVAFALWSALSHVRLFFFAGLILPPLLSPRLSLFQPYARERDKRWLNAAIMAAVVGAVIYFYPSQANLQGKVNSEYPAAALEYMHKQHVSGRIFNSYKFGGYMEWYASDLKPFIDGRADIFVYNGVFDDYGKIVTLDDTLELLERYKIDYVLYEPKMPLCYLLRHSPNWHLLYSDNTAVLFERVQSLPQAATRDSGSPPSPDRLRRSPTLAFAEPSVRSSRTSRKPFSPVCAATKKPARNDSERTSIV
jgi:hypothetical protein